ncbi:MAG: ComEC/Rec2 family competence protein [Bacilli bacterium]
MKKIKTLSSLIVVILLGIISVMYTPDNFKTSIKEVKTSNEEKQEVTGNLSVSFIDVGQADCILVENNNEYMLIDAGNNADGELLVNYFKELSITKFKYIVGTHPHEDHIGGMDNIIDSFDIGTIYMPKTMTTTNTFESVLDAVKRKNLKITTPNIGDEFKLGMANFEVLYLNSEANDLNDTSIVLKLTYGNNSYLFMGDASKKIEKEILDKNISTDVLKIGHHGSEYSSSSEFLEKVQAKYAIISVGKDNIYKHPKDITLETLESMNMTIYRTDELGTIKTISDGNNIKITYEETNTDG